ncbi:MAG: hypothetical protein WDA09_11825 [Bacteriovoracaceae bacterium]
MSKSKRGPYNKTKNKMVSGKPSNFLKVEHEHSGHIISWANAVDRGDGQISVLYKIFGERKQYRCPRYKTAYLDALGLEFAKLEVQQWKNENNNNKGRGDMLPPFYLSHRVDFLQYLHQTARHTTIDGYEAGLRQYVFPYFIGRLKLDSPSKWTLDSIVRWENFLCEQIPKASSRNRRRTAFRRYLKFLKFKGIIKTIPLILDEQNKRDSMETPIPGELPQWDDVLNWLRKLPPGRYRFVRTVAVAFGLRISEALAVEELDILGNDEVEDLKNRGDFLSNVINKGTGFLLLHVHKAKKKKINKDIIKILGDKVSKEPKSGPYTACCTNQGLAEFILELIDNGEHLKELQGDDVYKIIKDMPFDPSAFKFNEYRPHDDRRLNITLQCLDLSSKVSDVIETVCTLHGQSSRDVFNRYFQWGLTQRRKVSRKLGSKLKIIQVSGE